ncbi:hypothetical protein ACFX12_012022 [Malus domestica]
MVKKQPGRPKKRRIIRDPEMEKNKDPTKLGKKGNSKTCTKCWEKGHNRVGCKNQPREAPRGVYIDKRWAYQFHKDGSHGRGVNNNEGNEETHPTLPYQCSNVQQSGEVFVPQRNVTGESSRHTLNKKNARPSNLQVKKVTKKKGTTLQTSQPKYFNPANFNPSQNFVQPTITRGPRGGTFTTPNVSRTPITCQIGTSPIGTKTSSQANWPPMPQTVLCSNMSRPREGTFIIPNVTRPSATPTSLQARLPMPQTAPGSSMYMPSISRLSIQTTPSTSSTSGTSHSWKPPGKAVYTTNATTSSKKKNI